MEAMNKKFEILFVDTSDEEGAVSVEIQFSGQRLCVLTVANDQETVEIEFVDDLYILPEAIRMKFPLADFHRTLQTAQEDLLEWYRALEKSGKLR